MIRTSPLRRASIVRIGVLMPSTVNGEEGLVNASIGVGRRLGVSACQSRKGSMTVRTPIGRQHRPGLSPQRAREGSQPSYEPWAGSVICL